MTDTPTLDDQADLLIELGLKQFRPDTTYIDDSDAVWIGAKWDIAYRHGRYDLYRKGNWLMAVRTLDLAAAIIRDQEALDE